MPSAADACGNFQGWAALWVAVPYKTSSVALCSLMSRTLRSNTATSPHTHRQPCSQSLCCWSQGTPAVPLPALARPGWQR